MQAATLPAGLQSLAVSFFNQSLEKVRWPDGLRNPSWSFFYQSTEQVNLPADQQFNLRMEKRTVQRACCASD